MVKSNVDALTHGQRIAQKKRKQKQSQIEEIKWDDDSRKEYLTGFHKRKVRADLQCHRAIPSILIC